MNSVERGLITGILAKFLKGCDVVNLTERFVALLCVNFICANCGKLSTRPVYVCNTGVQLSLVPRAPPFLPSVFVHNKTSKKQERPGSICHIIDVRWT